MFYLLNEFSEISGKLQFSSNKNFNSLQLVTFPIFRLPLACNLNFRQKKVEIQVDLSSFLFFASRRPTNRKIAYILIFTFFK